MNDNTNSEINNILEKLDILKPEERLATLESDLEGMVSRFRDRINKEALEKLDKITNKNASVMCEKGHNINIYKGKKKAFF